MDEFWDVYDVQKRKTGKIIKRDSNERLQKGEYHLIISGIIQNSKKQILLTRRNPKKQLYPGLWECTGGSVKIGETSIQATIREIYEEIGIELKEKEGIFLGTIKGYNYFRDVWQFNKDLENSSIKFNDGEVIDTKWVSIEEYEKLYKIGEVIPSGEYVLQFFKQRGEELER